MPATYGSSSNGKPILNGQIINHGTTGVRQTVQSGSVDANGYANFISIGTGLSVNLAATTVPLNIHSAGGSIPNDRLGIIPTDTTLALPASQTNFIMATIDSLGVVTLSSVILPIVYQFGGTPSVVANQYTFNIGEMKMYLGNGSTASQVWAVCVGEAVTSGTAVTSVVSYALNGMYDSGLFTATASATISKNHNIGCQQVLPNIDFQFTRTIAPFNTNDIVNIGWSFNTNTTASTIFPRAITKLSMGIRTTANIYVWINDVSTATAETAGNYRFSAKRGW